MARDPTSYRVVLVHAAPDPYTGRVAIRPLPGQPFATSMRVQCSRKLLDEYPHGTVFQLSAKMTDRQGGEPFLYAWHGDAVKVMPAAEVEAYLQAYRRLRI
jgi:hypothetical protein